MHRNIFSHFHSSIPFFFEPNFDALVKPFKSATRLSAKEGLVLEQDRKPVVYGDFLISKVGNNFEKEGKGRYDQ